MHPLRLKQSVMIKGRDYFGRPSWIQFIPIEKPGWFWLFDHDLDLDGVIPITPDIVSYHFRRLTLEYGKHRLEIYEHIGPLRWLGLDGVIINSSTWPPYFGRVYEFWEAIKSYCQQDQNREIPWFTISKAIRYQYNDGRRNDYLEIQPFDQPHLNIIIISNYPKFGTEEIRECFPIVCPEFAFKAYTQGWPTWIYHLSKFFSLLGWPHHDHIYWPQENKSKRIIHQFAIHRLSDLLGALSLVHPSGFLAANVISYCAGHEADVALIKEAKSLLSPLVPLDVKVTPKSVAA